MGTGKNSIAGNPKFKLKGRVILAEPFTSISDQAASEAWVNGDRKDQLFVNSGVEDTLKSFKKTDNETIKVNYETTLRGATLPDSPELVVHSTYNQILNIPFETLETFDYIFIDEAHTLSDGLNYRSSIISGLIYYLVEFVAKRRKSNTKIIFMSGTPNVETHVIPELMETYNIRSLFQRLIVDKSYSVTPTIHLTHLDTDDSSERHNTVIAQINEYLNQGRKVCHIFNHKSKMDEYVREIQSKLSNNIKVGLFYSGSTGECTRDILAGRFGSYDVVLATTYFINGINIEKDGLTDDEFHSGKSSKQKYGVVIDLGRVHTRVNAMDAIQAINRFRNRRCHSTIFLPKIFKPDLNNTSRQFDFKNAAKVLLGINKYNCHLLSVKEDLNPFEDLEDDKSKEEDLVLLLDSVRKNPIHISLHDIEEATKEEENRARVFSMITSKARLYEDWFCSLDGYHYLAKDAGFLSIIKHKAINNDLEEMSSDQIELENKVVSNFLTDPLILDYLEDQIDPTKRILLKSSGKITYPESTEVSNFVVKDLINDKYILEGDFHISHERSLNKVIRNHLSLLHYYGKDQTIDLVKAIVDPEVKMLASTEKRLSIILSQYVKSCKNSSPSGYFTHYSYMKGLEIINNILKFNSPVSVTGGSVDYSFVIPDPYDADKIKSSWAEAQYDSLIYKIENSASDEKDELKKYYSKKDSIKEYDISSLKVNLSKLGKYRQPRKSKKDPSKLLGSEQLSVFRVLRSDKLLKPTRDLDPKEWASVEEVTMKDLRNELLKKDKRTLECVEDLFDQVKVNSPHLIRLLKDLSNIIQSKKLTNLVTYFNNLVSDTSNPQFVVTLGKRVLNSHLDYSKFYTVAFKLAEYTLYKECKIFKRMSSLDKYFFVEEDFKIKDIKSSDEETIILNEEHLKVIRSNISDSMKTKPKSGDYWIALDSNNKVVTCKKSKLAFSKILCEYAYNNDEFILNRGKAKKIFNKGVYNYKSFMRDYVDTSVFSRQILNYKIFQSYIEF